MAQVVSRLFEMVEPDKAFFGQKDYQQVLIVRDLVKQLKLNVQVVTIQTVRDEEKVAMSSRNQLLSDEEYDLATYIPIWLDEVKQLAARYKISQIKARIETLVAQQQPKMKLDYFEICDANSLEPLKEFDDETQAIALIAVQIGKIRLIDNVML